MQRALCYLALFACGLRAQFIDKLQSDLGLISPLTIRDNLFRSKVTQQLAKEIAALSARDTHLSVDAAVPLAESLVEAMLNRNPRVRPPQDPFVASGYNRLNDAVDEIRSVLISPVRAAQFVERFREDLFLMGVSSSRADAAAHALRDLGRQIRGPRGQTL